MGHTPVLIPDYTLFIQLAIFLATYLVLRTFVLKPYGELIEKRHERTTGLREAAEKNRQEAERLREEYERFMIEERRKVAHWVEQQRHKTAEEEKAILADARAATGAEIDSVRGRVLTEVEAAQEALTAKVPEFASLMASRVLGYAVHVKEAAPIHKKKVTIEETVSG